MSTAIEEIEKISDDFIEAINKSDIRMVLYLYSNEIKLIPSYGDINDVSTNRWGTGYIQSYWQNIFSKIGGEIKYNQNRIDIQVYGEIAYEIGTYELRKVNNKEDEVEEGSFFILWKKVFDIWKIEVHVFNSTSQPIWGK